MKKIMLIILGIFALFSYILHPASYTPTAFASGTCSTGATTVVQDGLVSAPDLGNAGLVTNTGTCIIDPKAAFAPYKIPSYEDLESLYYTQAKSPVSKGAVSGSPNQGQFISVFNQKDVVLVNGDLPSLNYTGKPKPSIVFVEKDLSINDDIDANPGLVFIVKGDVNIDPSVTSIDAVIIASGTIYTAGAGCANSSVTTSDSLIINGSLISLKQPPITDPNASYIKFCRTLSGTGNDTAPAEKIIHQVKYLVILRNLLSDTFQRWSETP